MHDFEPPPIIAEIESSETPPPIESERRSPLAWVVFLLLMTLLVSASIGSYFVTGEKREEDFRKELSDLQLKYQTAAAFPSVRDQYRDAVQNLLEKTKPLLKNNDNAVRIYLILGRESGAQVDPTLLTRLEKSKNSDNRKIARVLKGGLKGFEIDSIQSKMSRRDFADKLTLLRAYEAAGDRAARDRVFPTSNLTWQMLIQLAIFAAFLGGIAIWPIYWAMRKQGKLRPVGFPPRSTTPLDADRSIFRFNLFLMAFLGVPLFAGMFGIRSKFSTGWEQVIISIFVFGALIWAVTTLVLGKKQTLRDAIGRTDKPGQLILWGFAGVLAETPIVAVLTIVGLNAFSGLPAPHHPLEDSIAQGGGFFTYLSLWLAAAVCAPLIEEIAFRGLLFPALAKALRSPAWGIIASSLLFASMHPQGLPLLLALAGVGATLAMLAYQTGSLVPGMVMHAVHNTALVLLSIFMT